MGKKSQPDPPDYRAAAEETGRSSREVTEQQTWANRPDQVTPFGSTSWENTPTRDPTTGQMLNRWTQTTTLDPELQASLDAQNQVQLGRSTLGANMIGRVADEYAPLVDYSRFTPRGRGVEAGQLSGELGGADDYYGRAGDALMQQFESRMTPKFARDEASQDAILRARGFKQGDEGYDQALADLRQSQGDQYNQAMYQAQQLSAQEAGRLQGMDQASLAARNEAIARQLGLDVQESGYNTQLRQQDISEELQRRGLSLNEINALLTGQQVAMPGMPSFSNAGRADAVNYSQAAGQQWQADMDVFNARQAQTAALMGAVTAPFSFG